MSMVSQTKIYHNQYINYLVVYPPQGQSIQKIRLQQRDFQLIYLTWRNHVIFFLLGKANIITRVPTVDASKSPPDFIFKMYFTFFNVKILRGFTVTFVAICSSASYPFEFPYRNNMSSLDKLKFLVNTLINQGKKSGIYQTRQLW